ncbi:unnamed protein product [Phyllotreta striolata]|uniref:Uncharacterized protein n=1 Tax=Phyllotreta striolata TaxID=444603 RepID=A0A9N9THD6_PHYSR|nr:unnamed protein product [Phyllotreta striolata]
MILQPSDVQLTGVHHFDRNRRCWSVSGAVEAASRRPPGIEKSAFGFGFGRKWVLKVNEIEKSTGGTETLERALCIWAFLCIGVIVVFGILFALNNTIFNFNSNRANYTKNYIYPKDMQTRARPPKVFETPLTTLPENTTDLSTDFQSFNDTFNTTENTNIERKRYCSDCSAGYVCMKTDEGGAKPSCVAAADPSDPTGCGGLCLINTEYCHKLGHDVVRCLPRRDLLACDDGQFNCQNMCVGAERRCDGVVDCSNESDEANCDCDLSSHFRCGRKLSCLELSKRCDRIVDCWDGSDERNCSQSTTINCRIDQFACDDGVCIDKTEVCDGVFHCSDRSDEPDGCVDVEK